MTNDNLMRPVKVALEVTKRELASELGVRNFKVNALSPRPVATRAAGVCNLRNMTDETGRGSSMRRSLTTRCCR